MLAIKRVETRVKEGGHHIPEVVIRRRYENGLKNFYKIYLSIVDEWMFIDNSGDPYEIVAHKNSDGSVIRNRDKWCKLQNKYI